MTTVVEALDAQAIQIGQYIETLLLKHSAIYRWNDHSGPLIIISASGDYAYRPLSEEGRQAQSRALNEYRHFHSVVSVLLKGQPKDILRKLKETDKAITGTIEQSHTRTATPQEALAEVRRILKEQLALVATLHSASDKGSYLVVDTNALLYNHKLDSWAYPDIGRFTIVLTPTVLSELDSLKVNHRNEEVRRKSESLIRQIKEFRIRGRLADGVPLVRDRSDIVSIAQEPDMNNTLPWLVPTNNDDRFLAGVIEVMRMYPRSTVLAVTRDINLQNKAEFARIPFIEPPEPEVE